MHIGIIGLGLIGGSIAKAIKKVHVQNSYITAYDVNAADLKSAFEEGTIDNIAKNCTVDFANCVVIFVCTPVLYTTQIVKGLLPHVRNDCIITDVGSTKYQVVADTTRIIEESAKRVDFVGGHPMTGSERFGYTASSAELFENAYYMLTPMGNTPDFILFILQKLIERMGALPLILSASYHDYATANISHLPHIVASSLVHLIRQNDNDKGYLHDLAAGGFKDITRVASSNPDIWTNICLSNKSQIQKVFKAYRNILDQFIDILDRSSEDELYSYFDTARIYRNTLKDGNSNSLTKSYSLNVDAKDEPGAIASIVSLLSDNHINIKNIGIISDREFDAGVLKISVGSKSDLLKATEILSRHRYNIYY